MTEAEAIPYIDIERCSRMGMGAGFYDRYLTKCVNASVVSVAAPGSGRHSQ